MADRKRKEKVVSSSSEVPRFKTLFHEAHYKSKLSARRVLPELIIQVDEDTLDPCGLQIQQRKWERFTNPIQMVGHRMVKEFYGNASLLLNITDSQRRASRLGFIHPRLALTSKSQLSEVSSHQRLGARHPTPSMEPLLKTAGKTAHPRLGVQYPRPAWRLLFPDQSQESAHQQGHAQAPDTPRPGVGSL
ncbi:hypothetical protein PIB30_051024 [Stylosanthes scabra]|uniref:Uncharacterized protein n=1 Tax=Stylosanthes scabra TaxID=79078 RepID=A0ABU6WI65_9FABA|nr:hypothetical protein [Stylosanthes scabra]